MRDYRSTFQQYVNMPYSQLENIAVNCMDDVQGYLEVYYGYGESKRLTMQLFATFASIDYQNISRSEYELFAKVTDVLFEESYSYSDFVSMCKKCERHNYLDDIARFLRDDEDFRNDLFGLAMVVAAVDNSIEVVEQKMLVYLDSMWS